MKDARVPLPILVEFVVWLALGLTAYALTFQFAGEKGTYAWGAASWPRMVILIMLVTAAAQFVVRLREHHHGPEDGGGETQRLVTVGLVDFARVGGMFAIPLVYVWLLPRTGFYVTTPFFLIAYLLWMGERRLPVVLGVPAIIYALVNVVFTRLFYVALPTGTWPGFYDVSNWFVGLLK